MFTLFTFLKMLLVLFVTMCDLSTAGKVLFLPAMVSPSHKFALATLADALAERNHEVHWWAPSSKLDTYQPKKIAHVEHFAVDIDDRFLLDTVIYENETGFAELDWTNEYFSPFLEVGFTSLVNPFCESVLKNNRKSFDKIFHQKWDLIVVDDLFSSCGYVITQFAKSPVITYVSTCRRTAEAVLRNKDPVPFPYIPGYRSIVTLKDRNSFAQRLITVVSWVIGSYGDRYYNDLITEQLSPYITNLEHITAGLDRPDFQFVCVPQNLDFPTPTMPNVINIGGIYKPATSQTLPEDYVNEINSATKGFILVTMGHWAKWKVAPKRLVDSFVNAFSRLPNGYVVFWQYDGHPIENLPKNVKVKEWLPQKILLAHPKCKLFVTHCGCNGLIESIQNGVPMIAVPLTADQPYNADMMTAKHFGLVINKNEVTTDNFHSALITILNDDSYRKSVRKFSRIMENELVNSLNKSVFWSEYAMRHQNRHPYKSPSILSKLSWIEYHSIDVGLCLIFILIFSTLIVISIIFVIVMIMKRFKDSANAKIQVKKKR